MGSGSQIQDVNRLLTQFEQMKKMMRGLSGMSGGGMPSLPGMPGAAGKHSGSNKTASKKNKRKPSPGFKFPFGRH